ncbi:MAG: hypothetical protein ACI9KN_001413 [Gammaproteobacteria bacterium]|jgi:hypothetical protein
MRIIQKYWRGELSLNRSFWWGFFTLGFSFHVISSIILSHITSDSSVPVTSMIVYQICGGLILFPWQSIGVLRSAERHYQAYGRPVTLHLVQASVLLSAILLMSHFVGLIQDLTIDQNFRAYQTKPQPPSYTLQLSEDEKQIMLRGPFDFGVTNAVRELLETYADIESIVLESEGGQIYEGRGLAILIDRYGIDTYSYRRCFSSCTTAFIGGRHRYLGNKAKLGFHQYGFDSEWLQPFELFYDLESEQNKDLELYRSKNINAAFLRRVFEKPNHDIWYPELDTLLDAGVVTAVVAAD